jgi:hypothetical protein
LYPDFVPRRGASELKTALLVGKEPPYNEMESLALLMLQENTKTVILHYNVNVFIWKRKEKKKCKREKLCIISTEMIH